jgi:hypothetical protein
LIQLTSQVYGIQTPPISRERSPQSGMTGI